MGDNYRHNLARNHYFQEIEYGDWYDRQTAHDRHYENWAQEVNARDEWARRNPPTPGSFEEHTAGRGGWSYGVDPYHAWRYGLRPVEGAIRRRNQDYGYWHPDEEDEYYEWHHPRRYRGERDKGYYEYAEPRRQRWEYVYPLSTTRSYTYPRYEVVGSARNNRVSTNYVLPAKYLFGGRKKAQKVLSRRFHGKEFKMKKRKWKDWPDVYIGDHPERYGIKVKTKWKDWPRALVA